MGRDNPTSPYLTHHITLTRTSKQHHPYWDLLLTDP